MPCWAVAVPAAKRAAANASRDTQLRRDWDAKWKPEMKRLVAPARNTIWFSPKVVGRPPLGNYPNLGLASSGLPGNVHPKQQGGGHEGHEVRARYARNQNSVKSPPARAVEISRSGIHVRLTPTVRTRRRGSTDRSLGAVVRALRPTCTRRVCKSESEDQNAEHSRAFARRSGICETDRKKIGNPPSIHRRVIRRCLMASRKSESEAPAAPEPAREWADRC